MPDRNLIHLALAIYDATGDYTRHVGATLASVFANAGRPVCAHLLHDETLNGENRDKLNQLATNLGQRIEFHPVALPPALASLDYGVLTRGAAYRLLIPEVLPLDRLIYLDGDIVVDLDIGALWDVGLFGHSLAVVRDLETRYWSEAHWQRVRHIGVPPELYFNSGVMVMNLSRIREHHSLLQELPAFLDEFPQATVIDQDFLNRLFHRDCVWLPERFNRFVAGWRGGWDVNARSEAIWHWAGPGDKPWNGFVAPVDLLYWRYLMMTPWYMHAEAGIDYFTGEVERLTHSRSWRLSRPYRLMADWLKIRCRRWFVGS